MEKEIEKEKEKEILGTITELSLSDSKDIIHIDLYEHKERKEIVIPLEKITDLAIACLITLTAIEIIIISLDYFKKK